MKRSTETNIHARPPVHRKTFEAYFTGLILCVLLTVVSFWLVAHKSLYNITHIYISLAVLALAQFLLQAICFLRLNAGKDRAWNLLPFLMTLLIVTIFIGGSLWIMYHLNYNMTLHD